MSIDFLNIIKLQSTHDQSKKDQVYKKILKNVLALTWISVVIYYYFAEKVSGEIGLIHGYYAESFTVAIKYLFFILIIPIIYACYCLYQWINKDQKTISIKITTPRILTTFCLLVLFAGNVVFFVKTPSFYQGNSLFIANDGQIKEVENLSSLTGDETLLIAKNSAYEWTNYLITDDTDPELKNRFEQSTFWGIQYGLITKSLGILLILSLITLIATGFGHTILKFIKKDLALETDTVLISFAIGLFSIIVFTFLIAAPHLLTIYSTWALLLTIVLISRKSIFEIINKLLKLNYRIETGFFNINLFIIFVLSLILSMNFIDNISPTARGWDGMNQYVNIAKRIEETNGLIQMGGNYYWELLMGFGLIATKWITIALNLASFYPALLSAIVLYWILSKFSSKSTALLVTAWFYTMPMMLFHGTEENKVDLGNTLIAMIGFLSLYKGLSSKNTKDKLIFIGIAGLLTGFCLGIKLTSLMIIFTFLTIILYKEFRKTGAVAGFLFSIGMLLMGMLLTSDSTNTTKELPPYIIGLVIVGSSVILMAIKLLRDKNYRALLVPTIFIISSLIAFSPWMIKNFSENRSLTPNNLLFGIHPEPTIDYNSLPEELAIDESLCTETGTREELDRYMGYENNIIKKYITLPWHLTMNDIGILGMYIDVGWIPLALLIGLLPFIKLKKPDEKWSIALMFFINYWLLWLATSDGIIWYGLPGFLAISILMVGLIENYKREEVSLQKLTVTTLILILLIPALSLRLHNFGRGNLLLYISNVMTADEATTGIFPYGLQVHDLFEADQDGRYDEIWKIGTSLNYFIEDNFWRTYNDQYMDVINCLYQERNPDLLTKRLKALGFGYIIFDYNTYALSADPDGTLNEKYQAVLEYILNYTDIAIHDYFKGYLTVKIQGTDQ